MNEMIMIQLLSHSFEGNLVEWFRNLTSQSIHKWGQLYQGLIKRFLIYGDDTTFLSLIKFIKRHMYETTDNFNIIFEKTWKSIPTKMRPTSSQALVYYRKAFHPNINILVIIYWDSFLIVYQTANTIEYMMVPFGKLQPKSIMPPFSNLSPKKAPL